MSTQRLNAFIIEEYKQARKDELQKKYHPCGHGVFHSEGEGLTLHLAEKMSIFYYCGC